MPAGQTAAPRGASKPAGPKPPDPAGDTPESVDVGAAPGGEEPDVFTVEQVGRGGRKELLFPQLPSLSRIMSVVMLVIGIAAVGILFYQLMIGFFVPLFLAALLVVIFRPVHDWLLRRSGGRRRVAAAATTALILFVVLLPVGLLVSVATTQFTILVSQMNLSNVSTALERVRAQFSLSLPHAAHFRELDELVDSLGIAGTPQGRDDFSQQADRLTRAASIIQFLQEEVGFEATKDPAEAALQNIEQFTVQLRKADELEESSLVVGGPGSLLTLNTSEQFEQYAVITAASIRRWMHSVLGGAVRSQLRLIANPSEADFASLIRRAREALQPRFVRLTSATGSILIQLVFGLVILIVAVYFFLIDGATMIRTLMRLSPMDDAYEHQLLMEFDRTSRAVVLASVLSAVVQGALAACGFAVTGFDQVALLFLITSVMALVPFLGAASVWLPAALWLGVVEQRWLPAILLALWGAAVVSSIDNVIKVFVLHGRSQLHPLFALLSVIGGVSVFGPIGILVGPMVVVFLQTLLEILNQELSDGGGAGTKGWGTSK